MRLSRSLLAAAVIMAVTAVVIPLLTAPAEERARALRSGLAVRVDSLTAALERARGRADTTELAREVSEAREGLVAADYHLAAVVDRRQDHWSSVGPGTVLVGFAVVLAVAGVLARRL